MTELATASTLEAPEAETDSLADASIGSVVEEEKKVEESSAEEVGAFKRKLPEEDKCDPFDRQRCILGWDQSVIQSQVALVLGVGGIGCNVAIALARLGVARIILVDYDKVETTNLSRQLLFSRKQIGSDKAQAAKQTLDAFHNVSGTLKVEAFHLDVTKRWDAVRRLAKQSTVVFNCVDVGYAFDLAVISLSAALKLWYVSGSSYAHSIINEHFDGAQFAAGGRSTFTFENTEVSREVFHKLRPEAIESYSELHSWLPRDENPDTRLIGSWVVVASMASLFMVNGWVQSLLKPEAHGAGYRYPNFSKLDICQFWEKDDIIAFPAPDRSAD